MTEPRPADLERLAEACGILPEYRDVEGRRQPISPATRAALIEAMGIDAGSAESVAAAIAEHEQRDWLRALPPVRVVSESEHPATVPLSVAEHLSDEQWDYCLTLEDGSMRRGSLRPAALPVLETRSIESVDYRRYGWPLPEAGCGYHELRLDGPGQHAGTTVIVTPERSYLPAFLEQDGRLWGPSLQLYALRSLRNWGIGDYGDLSGALEFFARAGAGVVGVGPLHSLYPHEPRHTSPYSPSSRLFWNVLYLDVEAVPGLADCPRAQELLADPAFRARIAAARDAERVDHEAVAAAKREILEAVFESFRTLDLETDTPGGQGFRQFREQRGESLRRHALYEALADHFRRRDPKAWGWPAWPEGYEHPQAEKVAAFEAQQRERVTFFAWLQWLAETQLAKVGVRAAELGLGAGLYLDLPLGADRGGSEVWARRELYAQDVTIGAPPDAFNLRGQNWGLPPWIPERLTAARYRPFIELLRANMRHAGALRLDHVMSLMRLFWIPAGRPPGDGAYVRYPLDDLLGILRLESHRNACLVIGEDLGTVPESLRETLASIDVLSNRLFYFGKRNDHFKPPQDWPRRALVAVSNHDLPTLRGYWRDQDIALRQELDLFPSEQQRESQVVERAQDRARILFALSEEGLLPDGVPADPTRVTDMEADLMVAIHRYLARTPAMILAFQMEDALLLGDQTNLPGTVDEYPNWRRKLPFALEHWAEQPGFGALLEALRAERGPGADLGSEGGPARPLRAPVIPRSTYRLQLSADFSFADTERLVPYLARLGVSHCYLSPYLKARPHSSHGYDVVDQQALNPEIGDRIALDSLCDTLRRAGMGQIVDVVPNHMAVMGSDNAWWLDVLENGQASAYAAYFDIDWQPVQSELHGKVLIPVLGEPYGRALENGDLAIEFAAEDGEFAVRYHDHKLPLDPVTYTDILGMGLDALALRLGGDSPEYAEYLSIRHDFGQLPPNDVTDAAQCEQRLREKEVGKRRLAELCRHCQPVREQIETHLAMIAGTPGQPESFERLHQLLERQIWRVAYWQVAADEINYRRFFDINELAGLRQEQPEVLEDTHQLVARLYRDGLVDGLRIDHPDGLYDPAEYFSRLQALLAGRDPRRAVADADGGDDGEASHAYVVVEKILAGHEHLREDWPVHGTTGYDFMFLSNGLLVYPATEQTLSRSYRGFTGDREEFSEQLYRCKRLIIGVHLSSELTTLANLLNRISRSDWHARDFTLNSMRDALTEITACFPVYRTYVTPRGTSAQDREYIDWAVAWAQQRDKTTSPELYEFIRRLLLLDIPLGLSDVHETRCRRFAMKFQQYTAPVMAKAMEDTSFYRYCRFVSLNEVGGEPSRFGVSVAAFHRQNAERGQRWPHGLLAGSTHDNKRSEDVRARLNVLSEVPGKWQARLRRWRRLNEHWRRKADDRLAPTRRDEYLYYQTLLGIWPLQAPDAPALADLAERLVAYMRKAVREAKENSSWLRPDADYEAALENFVRNSLHPGHLDAQARTNAAPNPFLQDLGDFAASLAVFGLLNSLSQTVLRLTAPGVPDIYQGNELWDFSLVDPDNRRPVDFDHRERLLGGLERRLEEEPDGRARLCAELMDQLADGRAKLYLIRQLLQLRAAQREVFDHGDYLPLTVDGEHADHVCAFARRHGPVTVIVMTGRWFARLQTEDCAKIPPDAARWGDTRIELPAGCNRLRHVFTGAVASAATGRLRVGELLAPLSAAVLIDEG